VHLESYMDAARAGAELLILALVQEAVGSRALVIPGNEAARNLGFRWMRETEIPRVHWMTSSD